jgi:hypothetical protein
MLAHLVLTVPLLLLVFGLMHWMGYLGLGRRMYELAALPAMDAIRPINTATTWGAFALILVQGFLGLSLMDGLGWMGRTGGRVFGSIVVASATGCWVVGLWVLMAASDFSAMVAWLLAAILTTATLWSFVLLWRFPNPMSDDDSGPAVTQDRREGPWQE